LILAPLTHIFALVLTAFACALALVLPLLLRGRALLLVEPLPDGRPLRLIAAFLHRGTRGLRTLRLGGGTLRLHCGPLRLRRRPRRLHGRTLRLDGRGLLLHGRTLLLRLHHRTLLLLRLRRRPLLLLRLRRRPLLLLRLHHRTLLLLRLRRRPLLLLRLRRRPLLLLRLRRRALLLLRLWLLLRTLTLSLLCVRALRCLLRDLKRPLLLACGTDRTKRQQRHRSNQNELTSHHHLASGLGMEKRSGSTQTFDRPRRHTPPAKATRASRLLRDHRCASRGRPEKIPHKLKRSRRCR
jgi:hypothetical protein